MEDESETLIRPEQPRPKEVSTGPSGVLLDGDLVAGRYRVIRFIARGGMGEVYEVEDSELHVRLALKLIRPSIAAQPLVMDYFKREIQLARRVTHRGVCRIFDLGFHSLPGLPAEVPGGRVAFLTMELLCGETLAHRLRRGGPLRTVDALPIVERLASALNAAHQVGVVHRDFKSANVILLPDEDHPNEVRAVITDFGLARENWGGEGDAEVTALTRQVAGSPAYMAPEQVEARPPTAAADIYALGVVMYEMVTGRWPFLGETPQIIALKRLREAPTPPAELVPTLDPRWDRAILRCLAREPTDRFSSALEIIEALTLEEAPSSMRRTGRNRSRWLTWAVASVVAGTIGGYFVGRAIRYVRSHWFQPSRVAMPSRPSIAVLDLQNLSDRQEVAWLSIAIAELVSAELGSGEQLRIADRDRVTRATAELGIVRGAQPSTAQLGQLRQTLAIDWIVVGNYVTLGSEGGGELRVDLRVVDAKTGDTSGHVGQSGRDAEMVALCRQLGSRIHQRTGTPRSDDRAATNGALPRNRDAARLYVEGISYLRSLQPKIAIERLEQANAIEPDYARAHDALALAWRQAGDGERSLAEAKRAFDLAGSLSATERLLVEARYREANGEPDRAIAIYQALVKRFPDEPDYGVRLERARRR